MRKHLPEFLRFCVVGFTAFCVDSALLEVMVRLGMGQILARCISLGLALQISYLLHGIYTYRNHQGYSVKHWLQFIGSNLVGALVNYLVFIAVLFAAPFGEGFLTRLSALVAGTAVALFFNYWANKRFVFIAKEQ